MKGKIKKLVLAACLTVPCALVTTACGKDGSNGGICADNSCQFTKHFTATEFLDTPFYDWASSKNFSKKGKSDYTTWVQENFYDLKVQKFYTVDGSEPIGYYTYHAAVCETCGNINVEKHTFEHTEDKGGFNHNIKCTECDYTHDAACCFEINGDINKLEEDCFCGHEEPTYTIETDPNDHSLKGYMACIPAGTTGDIVIPKMAKGKPITKVQFSISEDWANQQIKSITIPYTAINRLELPANNHIEKIIITGYTQAEAEEFDAKQFELQQKLESGEISTSQFQTETKKIQNIIAPVSYNDAWMKLNGLSNLKSIEIAENQYTLNTSNFIEIKNCTVLENVETNSTKTTFQNCPALTSVTGGGIVFNDDDESTLPSALTEVTISLMASDSPLRLPSTVKTVNIKNAVSIPENFLEENSTIQTINAPGVLTVNYRAFYRCTALKTINLPDATQIKNNAFEGCTSLENISLPNVTKMGYYVFYGCTSLESADISKATDLDTGLFYNCTSLKTVKLCDNLTKLHMSMFENCSSLEEITIPKSVTYIDYLVFDDCHKLKTIRYNAVNATLDSRSTVFYNIASNVTGGAELIIGKDVEVLPENLTKINDTSQSAANNITKITFEEGSKLTTINKNAFFNLKFTTITLPSSVTKVEDGAFAYNYDLQTINFGTLDLSAAVLNNCPAFQYEVENGLKYFGKSLVGVDSIVTAIVPRAGTTRAIELDNFDFVPSTIKPYIESVEMPNTIVEWRAPLSGLYNLETVTLSTGLTEICQKMFENCTSLNDVTIPNSVTKIGENAFRHCTALTSINIPGSVKVLDNMAFYLCENLATVTLNTGLETIKSNAFALCDRLASITLPSTVRTIGGFAFDSAGRYLDDPHFELTLNEGLIELSNYALHHTLITSITLPSTLNKIGENAFAGSTIQSITIPSTITIIERDTFRSCQSLTSVTLPSTLKTIRENAFQWCSNLQAITIPASVETIEDYAFDNCSKLQTINLEGDVTLSALAVNNCVMYKGQVWNNGYYKGTILTGLVDSTVPFVYIKEGTTEIASGVFTNNTSLKGVYIPESVTTITNGEFSGCTNAAVATGSTQWLRQLQQAHLQIANTLGVSKCVIELAKATLDGWIYAPQADMIKLAGYYGTETEITIPSSIDGVSQIAVGGFEGNTTITSVTMGNNVIAISENAFKNCTNLTEITISSSVYMIYNNAFEGCSNLTTVNVTGGDFTIYNSIENIGEDSDVTVSVSDPNFSNALTSQYYSKFWFRYPQQ